MKNKKELEDSGFRFVKNYGKYEVQIVVRKESGFLGMGGTYTEWASLPCHWLSRRFVTLEGAIVYANSRLEKSFLEVQ